MIRHRLCGAAEVPEGGGRGFRWGRGTAERAIFVIRYRDRLHAYRNACPHQGSPLDWQPDRFFNLSGDLLLCATHGALFRPQDGTCVAGPCVGRALVPVGFQIENGLILIAED